MKEKYVELAKKEYPEGENCNFCGKENDLADDCGWFYLSPGENFQPHRGFCCRKCYNGPVGESHRKRFGVGER